MSDNVKTIAPVNLISTLNPFSTAAEQYRRIRTSIEFSSSSGRKIKSLVVTSPGSSEGKSMTAANLAIVFANAGSRVVLVDADLRRPNVAASFQVSNEDGLSSYLVAEDTDSIDHKLIETDIDNLYLLPSGPTPPNPSELLNSKQMQTLVDTLTESFDLVIFDMPPVVSVTDTQIMAANVDGTILVVRERTTRKKAIFEAKRLLDVVQAKIIGVIYNGKKQKDSSDYYYGSEDQASE